LLDAIRNDTPHDETRRSCLANLAALMGRAAAHGGQIVTRDQIMQSRFAFCTDVDTLRAGSPPPVQRNDAGAYPAPEPGRWREV
jgi:type VI protein secretion system component VasF